MSEEVVKALQEPASRRPTVRDRLAIPEVHAEDAAPPVEAGISWEGESMSVDEVIAQLPEMGRSARNRTVKGITVVLSWLQLHPGVTWQQRWVSSKIEMEDDWSNIVAAWWNEKSGEKLRGEKVVVGVTWIITVGSVRPGYGWLTRSSKHLRMFPETIIKVRDPETRQVIFDAIALDAGNRSQERLERLAQKAIAQVMAHTGKTRIRDIVPEDFIEARSHERRQGLHLTNGTAYDAMSRAGLLPEGAPERFVNLRRKTQPSIEEVVDRTGIKNRDVRNFFVDYMRAHIDMTHATMAGLTTQLVKTYWVEIERLAPGINSMEVSPQLFEQWLERAQTIQYGTSAGKKRAEISPLLTAIRRLYVDINDWANADPERYGKFAAPNPVAPGVTKLGAKTAHRRRAWSHARTRQRQPLLPALVRHVDEGRRVSRRLLDLAAAASPGALFTVDGESYRRATNSARVNVQPVSGGRWFDAEQREDRDFWRWALFMTLKETGCRIEEVEELTHTSLSQYRVPSTGQVLPLLQIAPSKTDKERVIVISEELADVLAAMLQRIRGATTSGRVPLVQRWDYSAKKLSASAPFLFQRKVNGQNRTVGRAWALRELKSVAEESGLLDEAGEPIRFHNHDFRRIFATEAAMSGLPIHILAKILGHDSLNTTQGYAAIYDEDVYRNHRDYIERRRLLRPSEEYREPTEEEFDEFQGHFEKRQLELGTCARAYGSDCAHEHACLRCSVFRPDPTAETRFAEIETNLEARIEEARQNRWLGEVEGLEASLAGVRDKLERVRRKPVGLGMPEIRKD